MKSYSEIVTDLITSITRSHPEVDTKEGTLVRDVIIDSVAQELASLYERLDTVSNAQSLELGTDADIVAFGENWLIYRKGTVKARGIVTFWRSALPLSDIVIPLGTIISTIATTSTAAISFKTIETKTMLASQGASYYNASTGKYEIDIAVEAVVGGNTGNVASTSIIVMTQGVSGIDGVYNAASLTGGQDIESISALKDRIVARLSGNNIGTVYGYKQLMEGDARVTDCAVVGPGNSLMERASGGAVDLYIKGYSTTTYLESFTPTADIYPDLVLSKQPVDTTITITVTSSELGELTEDVIWSFVKDSGSYSGSVYGRDCIHWLTPINSSYGTITVAYGYNSLIADLQNVVDQEQNYLVAADVLVKQATKVLINLTCSIQVTSGHTASTVISSVSSAVSSYLSSLGIGEDVTQSNLVVVIVNTAGVDNVSTPFTTLESSDQTITRNTTHDLIIPETSYVQAGTLTISQS